MHSSEEDRSLMIRSVEEHEGNYSLVDLDGKKFAMSDDEDDYTTVNYSAPLFH